jgi:MFS family permease
MDSYSPVKHTEPLSSGKSAKTDSDNSLPIKPVSLGFIITYALAYFGVMLAALTPSIVTLAIRTQQLDPVGKAHSLGLINAVGGVFVLIATPLIGKFCDRTTSRFGMRRPWIIGGLIGEIISVLIMALAPSITGLMVGFALSQMSLSAMYGGLTAILADQVPEKQRGRVGGLLNTSQPFARLGATFIAQAVSTTTFLMFIVPVVICAIFVLAFTFILHDRTIAPEKLAPFSFREFLSSFWVNPSRYPDFGWVWLGRFLFYMGLQTLNTYEIYFLTDQLHVHTSVVTQVVFISNLLPIIGIVMVGNFCGWLSDRLQRRRIFVLIACLMYAAGLLIVASAGAVNEFLIGTAIAKIGEGIFLTVDLALVVAVLPRKGQEAAKDLGIFTLASILPSLFAPLVASFFLTLAGGSNYSLVFTAAAVFVGLGAFSVTLVKVVG